MNDDQTLSETTPAQPTSVFEKPDATRPEIDLDTPGRQLTVAQILDAAKVPEKRASVCIRLDLQARYDELFAELGTLVNARGELLEDAEASMGDVSAASKARAINDQLTAVQAEMAKAMWRPLFRGMTSEDLAVFNKKNPYPDKPGADLAPYHNKLVAACAIDPVMSVEDVENLRKTLNHKAIQELVQTATAVCVGRIDVPKLPSFSVAPTEQ